MEEIKSVGGGSGFGDGGDGNEYPRRTTESDENEFRKSSFVPRAKSARSTNGKCVGYPFSFILCSRQASKLQTFRLCSSRFANLIQQHSKAPEDASCKGSSSFNDDRITSSLETK